MKPATHQLFAQLCEAHINEVSTAMNLIVGKSGGREVVQKLHKDMKLAHDLGYSSIDKISWSELKNARNGAWVIIQADNGSGAIRAINDRYEAVASTGGEVKEFSDGKGGNILDFFKAEIGKPRKFFVAKNTRDVDIKQQKRKETQPSASAEVTKDTLIKKFRPLWVRAMTAAVADIKGHIANMIKNDAFDKAKKKLNYLDQLNDSLEELQSGATDAPADISKAVNMAVLMAASHHFPEQTGNIERSRWHGHSAHAQFAEGPDLLLKAIAAGDTAKLGTVLGFFKKALITG